MVRLTPKGWRWDRRTLLFLAAAPLALTPSMARAQQTATHATPPARHAVVMMSPAHPRPAAVRPSARVVVPQATPRTGLRLRWSTNPGRSASEPPVASEVQPVWALPDRNAFQPFFAAPTSFEPFFFGAPFPGGFGSASHSDGLPMGFGLWPACDSAGTPGVFWTVGPCFGVGAYSEELAPVATSEYPLGTAPPSGYIFPLIFLATQPAPGPAAQQNPSAPAPAPTMLLYLADGKTISASDWWVAHGRLQYVTDSGAKGAMELSQLDLEQTIRQNESRGLEFHLKFTPPSDRH